MNLDLNDLSDDYDTDLEDGGNVNLLVIFWVFLCIFYVSPFKDWVRLTFGAV